MKIISDDAVLSAPNSNEAEIRFHIVDPIVRALGYSNKGNVYLFLEPKLEYPYIHVGRRSKKDLPLGFPDYRAGLKGARGSFIIEAKGGNVALSEKEIEQAHSYAAHAQVGANYFVLCNGSFFAVYETLSGPKNLPLIIVPLIELNQRFHEIQNILSPTNLENNYRVRYDFGLKLADSLPSSVRIRSGYYKMANYEYRIVMNGQDYTDIARRVAPELSKMDQQLEFLKTSIDMRVSDGTVQRGSDGRISANVEFTGATTHNHQAMEILGITTVMFSTMDSVISDDADSPSIFESEKVLLVPKGTTFPQFFGESSTTVADLTGKMFVSAAMYYENGKVFGQYVTYSDQSTSITGYPPINIDMKFSGRFELVLDVC